MIERIKSIWREFVASWYVTWWYFFNSPKWEKLNQLYIQGMPLYEAFLIVLSMN